MSSEGRELGTRTPDLLVTSSVLGAEEHLFQQLSPLSPSPQLFALSKELLQRLKTSGKASRSVPAPQQQRRL